MTATPPVPAPAPRKPRRRLLRNVALLLAALFAVWLIARPILVRQMVLPRLVLEQPVPSIKPPLEWQDNSATVGAVAISQDGKTILSGSSFPFAKQGKEFFAPSTPVPICFWDARTGRLRRTIFGHTRQVDALACSFDGKTFASSGWDKTIRLWDMATGQLLWTQPGTMLTSLVFSPGGKLLADRGILREAATGRITHVLNNQCWEEAGVAFSPDGKTFACVEDTHKIVNKTAQELSVYEPDQVANSIKVVGRHLQLWDVGTGKLLRTLPYDSTRDAAFSPDGKWLACLSDIVDIPSGSNGSVIRLVDAQTGAEKWTWKRRDRDNTMWDMNSVAFSPNGKWLACATIEHDVALLNARTGSVVKILHSDERQREGAFTRSGSVLGFSRDGKTLVSRGSHTVQVWDASALQ